MKVLDRIALVLVIIGALNWGAVGLFRFDCVAAIFGGQAVAISRVIYALVGISGLWCITLLFRNTPTEAWKDRLLAVFPYLPDYFIIFIFFSMRLRSFFLRRAS